MPSNIKAGSRERGQIRRIWGDMEVVDAKTDLRLFVLPEDVQAATPRDPRCCIVAQCARRSIGCARVLIGKCRAYLDVPGPDGKRHVERFILPKSVRDYIHGYDDARAAQDAHLGLVLKAPSDGKTLDAERKKEEERRKRDKANGGRVSKKRSDKKRKPRMDKDSLAAIDLATRPMQGVNFARYAKPEPSK